jgi:methionyl-tRNA synthetase
VNDKPHIGHAYTTLACDLIARFKRLDGYNVFFMTGTDEHGQKIERSAEKAGIRPIEFVDSFSAEFKKLMDEMNFSYDKFMRTSDEAHKLYVQQIWLRLVEKGYIYEGKYSGWYAVRDEAFYQENELVDGKAPTGAPVEWVEEPSYFFKLSAFTESLLAFYEQNPNFIAPETRRNEVISFVKSGLHDLSISRTSFSWGIKVPGEEKHVMYVWLDALFNYLSGVNGENSEFWPADLHIVGKDILRFHAVYWQAFLMAANIPTPKRIFAHGWWTNNGEKISKSLGNVIDPLDLVKEFGLEYVRYFLMREIPFGNDGNYTRVNLINRVNAELVNNIGNLAQRVLAFLNKYCNQKVPTTILANTEDDIKLLEKSSMALDAMRKNIDQQQLHLAIGVVVELAASANEYIDHNAPWHLNKTDKSRMDKVLVVLLEVIKIIAILLQSIVPTAAVTLFVNLGISPQKFTDINKEIPPGTNLPVPVIVFPRLLDN